jgi:hypothetical protein
MAQKALFKGAKKPTVKATAGAGKSFKAKQKAKNTKAGALPLRGSAWMDAGITRMYPRTDAYAHLAPTRTPAPRHAKGMIDRRLLTHGGCRAAQATGM